MEQVAQKTRTATDGRHDFDFFFGSWRQANRKRAKMFVPGDDEWVEFESETWAGPILGGLGNIDTFDAPEFPGRHRRRSHPRHGAESEPGGERCRSVRGR